MNFIRRFAQSNIFEKVVDIATIQKDKIIKKSEEASTRMKNLISQSSDKDRIQSVQPQTINNKNYTLFSFSQKQPTYQESQNFIISMSQNSKILRKQQYQKVSKKQIYSDLQIQPIYLQNCHYINLLKMQIQLGENNGYERTQVLHQYLKQINSIIRRFLTEENCQQILLSYERIEINICKIDSLLTKIKILRKTIQTQSIQKANKIQKNIKDKLIIKQKLALLQKMKQKQQITLTIPINLEQVYYSERSRHKLYLKIKNVKNVQKSNTYLSTLKDQLIRISRNNVEIIEKKFLNWINYGQEIQVKNIEKLFICLYFIQNQLLYKDNKIIFEFDRLNTKKLIEQIEKVKNWSTYQYIRESSMKAKIIDYLNHVIEQIQEKS